MKKIITAFAMLLTLAACTQNKPAQQAENEETTTVAAEHFLN